MKTESLVSLLAGAAQLEPPVPRHVLMRTFAPAVLVGGLAAVVLMLLVLGVRPDLAQAVRAPLFWAKVAYVLGLGVPGWLLALRLARPGQAIRSVRRILPVAPAVFAAVAAVTLLQAAPDARAALWLGATWRACPWLVALLALPVLLALLLAMRRLAPVEPRLAGGAAGLAAGTLGALVYCLHCPESAPPFVLAWYTLGMVLPAALGGWLGERVLRW